MTICVEGILPLSHSLSLSLTLSLSLSSRMVWRAKSKVTTGQLWPAGPSLGISGLEERVCTRLSRWKWLLPQLSYRGRVLVANNLVASTLWHKLCVLQPPTGLIQSIQRSLVTFSGQDNTGFEQRFCISQYKKADRAWWILNPG